MDRAYRVIELTNHERTTRGLSALTAFRGHSQAPPNRCGERVTWNEQL